MCITVWPHIRPSPPLSLSPSSSSSFSFHAHHMTSARVMDSRVHTGKWIFCFSSIPIILSWSFPSESLPRTISLSLSRHMRENTWHFSFWVWLVLLTMVIFRFTHFPANNASLFKNQLKPHCTLYPLSVGGHPGQCHISALLNKHRCTVPLWAADLESFG